MDYLTVLHCHKENFFEVKGGLHKEHDWIEQAKYVDIII